MKYTTFRALVGTGALVIGGGALALGLVQCGSCMRERNEDQARLAAREAEKERHRPKPLLPPAQPPAGSPVAAPPTPPAGPVGTQAATEEGPLRDLDRKLLARVKQGISGASQKDAVRGEAWKVNLYKDAGKTQINRAKVDFDRDEKWDEKWTFEDDGRVKRQVAPADDESYTVELRLEGERWRRKK